MHMCTTVGLGGFSSHDKSFGYWDIPALESRHAPKTAHADLTNRRAQLDGAPLFLKPGQHRIDEERAQVLTGQHEVVGGRRAAQTVTQHPQEIEGFGSGYQGQGVKTILPSDAQAKMEVRLVLGLEPQDVLDKIRQQLDKNGYPAVELTYTLGDIEDRKSVV